MKPRPYRNSEKQNRCILGSLSIDYLGMLSVVTLIAQLAKFHDYRSTFLSRARIDSPRRGYRQRIRQTSTNPIVTALTPFQINQLTARRDALLPEWELLTEKVKRLRMALVIETGAAVKFQLEQQLLAEDEKLSKLAAELAEIEQKLSQAAKPTQIDWLDRSRHLLQAQKHLTTNRLLNKSNRNLDDIHVPLGLIERKERPKVKEEPSPEQGSQLYQTEYTETKRFEHEAFLAEVVGNRVAGKHIAIIGEPGAGKTTILTKIGAWLSGQAEQQPPAPLVVAWISLADVGDRSLEKYLKKKWLKKVCEDNFDAAWDDWKGLRQQGRVWLFLDGLDEMSGDALAAIHRDLGQAWAQNLRVVMTCRLNQWETAAGGNILTNSFDVYRTLDYSYQTSQGEDQVKEFIGKWFADNQKVATQIRTELDAPGKERIKDLVKNPLRLTLLCASWEKDHQALPETQADLYQGFVNYLYKWKAAEFSDEVKLRQELDLALGKLAKAGLNRQPINDGAVRRFRFTASEISELWADRSDTLLPAAKNLGWLNVVGEEAGEAVYAFYHPTFQEYFAACRIDDWDYFLPRAHIDRPVPCQGEVVPTYRVFEQEWRQVILLWMGRRDKIVTNELKEEFIDKLTDFREQEKNFYYYRAYCMAAIYIGESKFSPQTEEIVQQIIKWAFGDFDTEKQEWNNYLDPISSLARETIPFAHRRYAIDALISLVGNPTLADNLRCEVARALGKIAMGDRAAIDTLISLLKNPSLDVNLHDSVSEALGEIVVGDRATIDTLISLLENPSLYANLRCKVARTLGEIAMGDRATIDALTLLVGNPDLDSDWHYNSVTEDLGKIAVGDRATIDALISLLENPALDANLYLYSSSTKVLGEIAVGDKVTIDTLISLLKNSSLDANLHYSVAMALDKIKPGNRVTIDALMSLLGNPALEDFRANFNVVSVLGKIAVGDRTTIDTLISSLENTFLNEDLRYDVASVLGKIAVGDRTTIDALISLLKKTDLADLQHYSVIRVLGEIAVGDKATIDILMDSGATDILISLLGNPFLYNYLRYEVAVALDCIKPGNKATIDTLISLLDKVDKDEDLGYVVKWHLNGIAADDSGATDTLISLLENPSLDGDLRSEVAKALGEIMVGDKSAIDTLISLVENTSLENWQRSAVAKALGKIEVRNRAAIDTLISLLEHPTLNEDLCYITSVLGEIAVGDRAAIDALILLLENPALDINLRHTMKWDLCKIAVGDRIAIDTLISRVKNTALNEDSLYNEIVEVVLGKIAMGDRAAIDTLILLLENPTLNEDTYFSCMSLDKILTTETMPSVIWWLKNNVKSEVYDSNFEKFNSCFRILFKYAQILSYTEFHTTWHKTSDTPTRSKSSRSPITPKSVPLFPQSDPF